MPDTIRSFIAIALPRSVRDLFRTLQEALRGHRFAIRWVRPENIHLTLKFLGEIPQAQVPAVGDAIQKTAGACEPIQLAARGLGVFPDFRRARVVWAGVTGQTEVLSGMLRGLEECLEGIGFSVEKRPFKAHLTLGRVKGRIDGKQLAAALEAMGDFNRPFVADRVILYRSDLKSTGAEYTPLTEVPLGGILTEQFYC